MAPDWATRVDDHRVRVRADIVTAALALVSERGMAAVTMSQLAARAGISRATLYKYFADVPHVLMAWVLEEVDRSLDRLEAELAGVEQPTAKLKVFVAELLAIWAGAEHRFGAEQLSAGMPPEAAAQMEEQMDRLRGVLTEILVAGLRAGQLRDGLDVALHADLTMHMLGGLRTGVLRQDRPVEEVAAAVSGLLLHGITAGPGAPPR